MLFGIRLLTSDTDLGRVDYSSLSDQILMEMLVEGFNEDAMKGYKDSSGDFLDVCQWANISCDKDQNVVRVRRTSSTSGSIEFSCLPPKVRDVSMCRTFLLGTLETSKLPASLENFIVHTNKFHGTVDFTSFPDSLVDLSLDTNAFSGSALPGALLNLRIHDNNFSGSVRLDNLPPKLALFSIGDNSFTGDFRLVNVPTTLGHAFATCNSFNPTAIVQSDKSARLNRSGAVAVVDEEGKTHRYERYMLQL